MKRDNNLDEKKRVQRKKADLRAEKMAFAHQVKTHPHGKPGGNRWPLFHFAGNGEM